MLNRGLLLAGGKSGGNQTIGVAGGMGFGVGVYGGDSADLDAMGLTPMSGYYDPSSDNYGNYRHSNGSVMVFIPAFCYRVGNAAAPSYSRDNANALEIRDAALGEGDGWVLHRAFIDGGVQKLGFFIDKYICSKDSTGKLAISVKNGDNISLSTDYVNSSTMPNCSGQVFDAIPLSRARGEGFSLTTGFQWSAIAMLSLAHGQAATSSQFCGWYDAKHEKNYPKGNNSWRHDCDDSSVTWTAHVANPSIGKTGSGTPFVKTTHNGQACGVTDVNGSQWQAVLGFSNPSEKTYRVFKDNVKAHDITKNNVVNDSLYATISASSEDTTSYYWGANAFYRDASGINRALCGLIPYIRQGSGNNLFGRDTFYVDRENYSVLLVAGDCTSGTVAGVWTRSCGFWGSNSWGNSFRVAGYAS